MKIARLYYPVKVLGPGNRVGIWTVGCHRRCEGCMTPELWDDTNVPDMRMEDVIEAIKIASKKGSVDGITISGGEPLNQSQDLKALLELIHSELGIEDIIIFTGYDLEESTELRWVLEKATLVVDGTYDDSRNRGEVLRGSDNQRFYYKDDKWREYYEAYMKENDGKMRGQVFRVSNGVDSIGIHQKGFREEVFDRLLEKGITRVNK